MNKNYSLSIIRLMAMVFVLFCHVFEQSGYLIIGNYLAVGVQLFLLLSGYLYSKKEFKHALERVNFVIKNFVKILIDYYICILLFFIPVYYLVQPEMITAQNLYNIVICKSAWRGIHHLWYIPYCLFCYMITPVLYDIKQFISKKKYFAVWLISILGITEILMASYRSYFLPSRINCYVIGFFLPEIKRGKDMLFSSRTRNGRVTEFVLWMGGGNNLCS